MKAPHEHLEAGYNRRRDGNDLKRMVGFRNIAIRRSQDLDLDVLDAIVRKQLGSFELFVAILLEAHG